MLLSFAKCISLGLVLSLIGGCGRSTPAPRILNLHQNWSLPMGTEISGYPVSSSLGDISLELGGDAVRMPFNGTVEPTAMDCVLVSSDDIPAYLFRLCGLSRTQFGPRQQGQTIGRAHHLIFAMLRREPDGTWAMVEPSAQFIKQLLKSSP
ncbi:hypothetical protein [Leptothoe sp. PORK10 BA2]|uniref:hypothetical protein n=1 Tax=Leptothoe sp. PORK10 BA2 TaxID=3110254 RepID=UPI002B214AA1|nr:hypothetical protein [Leptothoe sp. PORK10 BA2]MEA5463906.1 hypothetical protein [Leptothoe sp. PORK10 BA2]